MTSPQDKLPFVQDARLDKPGIVGARWWQEGLESDVAAPVNRRAAISGMLVAGAAVMGVAMTGVVVAGIAASSDDDDVAEQLRSSLQMQREYGWAFGAAQDPLTFDGATYAGFDRAALARMVDELAPVHPPRKPFYVPTLFQSPGALPLSKPQGDDQPFKPLKDVLTPIHTPTMKLAYRDGQALGRLFETEGRDVAVVVDLTGPEAVAFAAGAAERFDVVFLFDNWPHPKGVVQAHRTLAAAAHYQPRFAKTQQEKRQRGGMLPMLFVLDRNRLATYVDNATQFDNRHVAKLPSAAALAGQGVKRVLYMPTKSGELELDDLNDDFVEYAAAKLDVKVLPWTSLGPHGGRPAMITEQTMATEQPSYYGSAREEDAWFWVDYPWVNVPRPQTPRRFSPSGNTYEPKARTTAFSSGMAARPASGSTTRPRPASFGMVPVVVAAGTGLILGAKLSRSGSWNRSSGGYGG